jgi:hypothetical protein
MTQEASSSLWGSRKFFVKTWIPELSEMPIQIGASHRTVCCEQIRLLTSSRAERHYGTAQSSHAISLTIVFCNKRLSRYSIRPGNSKKVYQLIYCPWANYVWLPDYMSDQHLTLVKCRNDTESYLTWLRILGAHVPLVTLRQAGSTNPMEPHRRNSMGRKPAEPLVDPRTSSRRK